MTTYKYTGGGLELGADLRTLNRRIYVSLRSGRICETSDKELPGYVKRVNYGMNDTPYPFYAKEYDSITGFITDVRWHEHTLDNGNKVTGWKATINTTKEVFVLTISATDRPFTRFMGTLRAVEFAKPVLLKAFKTRNKTTGRDEKFLLLSQEKNVDGTFIWLKEPERARWLNRELIDRCKAAAAKKIAPELTEEERDLLCWNEDGTINWQYPYITQKTDGKWSFDNWTEHLHECMRNEVIPAIAEANTVRGPIEIEYAPEETADAASVGASSGGGFGIGDNFDEDVPPEVDGYQADADIPF